MSLDSLPAITRRTLHAQAFETLHAAITSGEMPPGARLGESALAAHLGVSRTTVREALRTLQERGLVESDGKGKHRVPRPTPREIRELFRVRAVLEGLAATEIIESPDREAIVERVRAVLPPEDYVGMTYHEALELDLAFHETMCRESGNEVLTEVWLTLRDRISIVILSGQTGPVPNIMARVHHAPIVEALESGDAKLARQVVAEHMQTSAHRWAPEDHPAGP